MPRHAKAWAMTAGFCLLVTGSAGQVFTAGLTGMVADPTGGAILEASVQLSNTATGEQRRARTGADGRYTFSQLLPGRYEITVEAPGFRAFVQRDIVLKAGQAASLDITLQVGEITQRVEVSEALLQLDTQSANQSVTMDRDMVVNLPMSTRNPMTLVQATAGVTALRTGLLTATQDQNMDRFGFNGGRGTTALVLLDGVSATANTGWNGLLYSPSVDSVQEVHISRNAYDAQYGRSGGGVVSIVTRGGSSKFHGSAFEFLRNSALDANTWANNRAGLRKPIFQRNQFGGALSGPIWEAKRLFFFTGYEGLRQGTPATTTVTLPTAEQRSGDFSRAFNPNATLSVIYDPFSTRANPAGAGSIRDPFPGNRIPAAMLDPVGVKAVKLYPAPNNPGDPITGARNYIATGKAVAVTDRADIRVDWVRSEKHSLYARYSQAFRLDNLPAAIWVSSGDTGPIHANPRFHMTVGNTWVPNPSWVVNLLIGSGSWIERQRSDTYGHDGTEIGLPAGLVRQFDAPTIPQIMPADYSNISYWRDLNQRSRVDNMQLNATREKDAHSIKFGMTWESAKVTGGSVYSARFSFNRRMTSGPVAATNSTTSGNSIASMLLGTGSSGSVPKSTLPATNYMYYGFYVQDTWRLSRRITINPGLRYEIQRPPTERFNRSSVFHWAVPNPLGERLGLPLYGGLVFLDSGNRFQWDTDWNDLAPRLAIAVKVTDRISLRSGYGIFYPLVRGGINTVGFSSTTPWVTSRGGDGITPQDLFRDPFPQGLVPIVGSSLGLLTNLGLDVSSNQRDYPSSYMQNYSLDLQWEIRAGTLLEVGYAGHQGRKLGFGLGLNDNQIETSMLSMGAALDQQVPNPFYGHIASGALAGRTVPRHRLLRPFPHFTSVSRSGNTPGGSSSYNAFLTKFVQRSSRGLNLILTYQWSKAIDDLAEGEPGLSDGFRDYRNLRIERVISAHDIPHSLVAAFVYDLPVGEGRALGKMPHPLVEAVAGGWQVSGIVRLQSGLPFRVTAPSTISQYGFGAQYPNLNHASEVKVDRRTPERWFNTTAFMAPPPYTIGTMPRRITELRAAGMKHLDLAAMKIIRAGENWRVQFRAEFFNLTNTAQFAEPNASFGSSTFGQVSGTFGAGPRNIQLGLRLDF